MPVFFAGPIGRTVALLDPAVAGTVALAKLDAANPGLTWSAQRALITRITVAQQANYQFLHTLGNDIYIYAFGDRIGSITLSGLALAADCDDPTPDHGLERVLDWYATYKLSARAAPVRVAVGNRTTLEGFVSGISTDVVDPAARIVQFSLPLVVVPDRSPPP